MFGQWAFRIYGAHPWREWWLEEMVMRWSLWRLLVVDLVMWWGWRRGWWRQLVVDFVIRWRWQWSFMPLLAEDI
jgi:hypothetical protein